MTRPTRIERGQALTKEPREQCQETVLIRDTYRYTGRGPGGFSMSYTQQRCSRRATQYGYCWQHAPWHSAPQEVPTP